MKKIITLFALLAFSCPTISLARNSEIEKQDYTGLERNILENSGFENGAAGWQPSTASQLTTDSTLPGYGSVTGVWDAAANTDTLLSKYVKIPHALRGKACMLTFNYKWDGTATQIAYGITDGTTDQTELLTVSPAWTQNEFQFTCPDADQMAVKFISNSNPNPLYLDNLSANFDITADDTVVSTTSSLKTEGGGSKNYVIQTATLSNGAGSTCAITSQQGNWIGSAFSQVNPGTCGYNFISGFWLARPDCVCTPYYESGITAAAGCYFDTENMTVNRMFITTYNNESAADLSNIHVMCFGEH